MRILVIGHTYVAAENQKKLQALAAVPQVEVTLVAPPRWRDGLNALALHRPATAPFAIRAVPAVWVGHEQFYWYRSWSLGLPTLRPDVLCVEQGAGSVVYAQSLVYRNLYAPRTKAVFFTWSNRPYRARWPLRALERFNLRQSQGAVAGTADAARLVRDHGFRGPLLVLPQLGVDPVAFAPGDGAVTRRRLGLDRFTVGFVGRLMEDKGLRVLLDALAGASFEFQLLVVGRGPLEQTVRDFAAARGWGDRLRLVADAGHGDVPPYLNSMDVMVLPSRARFAEQFGHVLIEAMASGVAVVGSASGEIPNVIGEAGLVVPADDAPALRRALAELAAAPGLRRRLGEAGRPRVLRLYTHERIATRLVEFLRGL